MFNLKENGFECDDELVIPHIKKSGWNIDFVPWDKPDVDWSTYSVVIIRSTWDYQKNPQKFLTVLENIVAKGARLENPIELVRWNINKNYLLDLEARGIELPPTIKGNVITDKKIQKIFNEFKTDEIIIKPVISANADNTFRINTDNYIHYQKVISEVFSRYGFIAQPFRKNILTEGEYSLFFFDNKISHAILKIPQNGDFRVQEDHGGNIISVNPQGKLIEAAEKVIKSLNKKLLYARVDLVRNDENKYELMELELIEPSLYFRTCTKASQNFAAAFKKWFNKDS
jgi:Prokaryotic glutathione synthetase, ATP-grasp domain